MYKIPLISYDPIEIRNDGWGSGNYGARRRKADGRTYEHAGIDAACVPGQPIMCPFTSIYKRIVYPYANNKEYTGLLLASADIAFKIMYVSPIIDVGEKALPGDVIGYAQDISLKYPEHPVKGKMIPHIHFEIIRINPMLLFNKNTYFDLKV